MDTLKQTEIAVKRGKFSNNITWQALDKRNWKYPYFHEYIIWSPFHIMVDKLSHSNLASLPQSWSKFARKYD